MAKTARCSQTKCDRDVLLLYLLLLDNGVEIANLIKRTSYDVDQNSVTFVVHSQLSTIKAMKSFLEDFQPLVLRRWTTGTELGGREPYSVTTILI